MNFITDRKNPYDGVWFYPRVNRFVVLIGQGENSRHLGTFDALGTAVEARRNASSKTDFHPGHPTK